jgi:hypothetical protein
MRERLILIFNREKLHRKCYMLFVISYTLSLKLNDCFLCDQVVI